MADANIWVPGADVATAKAVGLLYKGTSGTSNTITDTGSLNFTIEAGLYFGVGEWLVIVDAGNITNWMSGQVVSYDDTTGALVFSPIVKHGSGTISDWLIYISGVWINQVWTGGTATDPVIINNILTANGAVTINAVLTVNGPIYSTAGDVNLNATTNLADANATLTAAQLFGGTLVINPTAARILTLPTAAQIIAYLAGSVDGSKFEFTVVNNTLNTVTIVGASGILQSGKTIVQDGSATFKVTRDSATVVSVHNISTAIVTTRSGAIISSRSITTAVNVTLTAADAGMQLVTATAEGCYIILPDARTLYVTSPTFTFQNRGMYPIGVKDASGVVIGIIDIGGQMILSLADNTTLAGDWTYTGYKLLNAFIATSAILDTSYGVKVFNISVQLTSDISVHFCEIASGGFSAFVVDNTNNVIATPYVITTTANAIPCAAFRVDDTRFIIFYRSAFNQLFASAVLLLGTVLVVGLASSTAAVSDIANDDGTKEPKIVQLDSNLFFTSYATNDGAGTTSVIACQVSDVTTVTFGSAANINVAADNQQSSTISFALTATTGLVIYKVAGPPKTIKAAVISVTNAVPPVCTIGTPVTLQASTVKNAPSAALLSPTLAVVLDDNNTAGKATAKAILIAGTSLTAGASLDMDTGIGAVITYSQDDAGRSNPHVYPLTDSTFLFWCRDSSGLSRVMAGSVDIGTGAITSGNKITGSFSTALDGSVGAGHMLPQAPTYFLGILMASGSTAATNRKYAIVAHQISGIDINVGKILMLDNFIPSIEYPSTFVAMNRTVDGVYAIAALAPSTNLLGADVGIQLVKTDGLNIIDLGVVSEYASGARKNSSGNTVKKLPIISDSRIISLVQSFGTKAPASGTQLRVSNIVLAKK